MVQGTVSRQPRALRGDETRFRIQALFALEGIAVGLDRVKRACLTVETAGERALTAYARPETLDSWDWEAHRQESWSIWSGPWLWATGWAPSGVRARGLRGPRWSR